MKYRVSMDMNKIVANRLEFPYTKIGDGIVVDKEDAETALNEVSDEHGVSRACLKVEPFLCQECGREVVSHKVKYADDSGIGSMYVCESCDEKSQGL